MSVPEVSVPVQSNSIVNSQPERQLKASDQTNKIKSIAWEVFRSLALGLLTGIVAAGILVAATVGSPVLIAVSVLVAVIALGILLWQTKDTCMAFNYIAATIGELLAVVALAVTYPVDLTRWDPKPQPASQTPILLVHGYLHRSSGWIYIRKRLIDEGLGPVYTINLGSPSKSIEDYAQAVKEKAEQIAKDTGRSDLLLVGHSMGGLVSSYYAMNLAPPKSVKAIVTLGSPLEGTKMAAIGIGRCARQMHHKSDPKNDFIRKLGQDLVNSDIPCMHLSSKTDLIIRPTTSAQLLANKKAARREFSRLGHAAYLFSPGVVKTIIPYIREKTKVPVSK
jgi:triacylglycerol lipase